METASDRILQASGGVRVTRHALEQFLARYPDEVLPKDPERTILRLLRRAKEIDRKSVPWLSMFAEILRGRSRVFLSRDGQWMFVVRRDVKRHQGWALLTVLRAKRSENYISGKLRPDRISNFRTFQSREAFRLVARVVEEAGGDGIDVRSLARVWRENRYPDIRHGGYLQFSDFLREAGKLRIIAFDDGEERVRPVEGTQARVMEVCCGD